MRDYSRAPPATSSTWPVTKLAAGEAKGAEVRQIRRRLGLTQAELSERLGVTANSVARWERDEMGIRPTAAALLRLMARIETRGKRR